MDLTRLWRVIKCNRWLTLIGLVIGAALAVFTYSVTPVTYASRSLLFVTQQGFPWGSTLPGSDQTATTSDRAPSFVSPARFIDLAGLYAGLVTSDVVKLRVVKPGEELKGKVFAQRLVNADPLGGNQPLPLVEITATATSPAVAVNIATRYDQALRGFISEQQQANNIKGSQRVLLDPVRRPSLATVDIEQARTLTRPIAIFLGVLILALALGFARENRRLSAASAPVVPDTLADRVRLAEPDERLVGMDARGPGDAEPVAPWGLGEGVGRSRG